MSEPRSDKPWDESKDKQKLQSLISSNDSDNGKEQETRSLASSGNRSAESTSKDEIQILRYLVLLNIAFTSIVLLLVIAFLAIFLSTGGHEKDTCDCECLYEFPATPSPTRPPTTTVNNDTTWSNSSGDRDFFSNYTQASETFDPNTVIEGRTFVATNEDLSQAVKDAEEANYNPSAEVFTQYGYPMGKWDVSRITDLSFLFHNHSEFNQDISTWEVDAVTDLSSTFSGAKSFNQDISNWHVGKVTAFTRTFHDASSFDQNLSPWEVEGARDMEGMFQGAVKFNKDISNWHVDAVTSFAGIFKDAEAFNQKLGSWEVEGATDLYEMFSGAKSFNQDISKWHVGAVTSFAGMFSGAEAFNSDIGSWEVEGSTDLSEMFAGATKFNQDVSKWHMEAAKDTSFMFAFSGFNHDISAWSLLALEDASGMFYNARAFNQDLCNWRNSISPQVDRVRDGKGIFQFSACPMTGAPSSTTEGPWCHECDVA